MKKRALLMGAAVGMMLLMASGAGAATFTTEDGVLSIDTPTDEWVQTADPNYWFAMSDGKSIITVDHLSNGESLPQVQVANDSYPAVYQAFVSTKNEVFVVKALAQDEADLQTLMTSVGTVKVLKYGTKTAIDTSQSAAPQTSEFGLREINAVYYVNTAELNIRSGCSTDDAVLGTLYYGEEVTVKGAVTRNGSDYGWYKISYNGSDAYASSGFLSETAPSASAAASSTASTTTSTTKNKDGKELAQCEYCGEWFEVGNDYRNHVLTHTAAQNGEPASTDLVQCEYCGQWFDEGEDYRNHVLTHTAAQNEEPASTDLVQCEYCGEWFNEGEEYRNHVLTHTAAQTGEPASTDLVQCEYCGEWFDEGSDYRNHLLAAHGDQIG